MRFLLLSAVAITACSNEPTGRLPEVLNGDFVGAGRNAMCIAGEAGAQRAGVIVYGKGDLNCSASGRLERVDGALALVPSGEGGCTIRLRSSGRGIWQIGAVPAACNYYCAPGVSLSGANFAAAPASFNAVDLGGDPLC